MLKFSFTNRLSSSRLSIFLSSRLLSRVLSCGVLPVLVLSCKQEKAGTAEAIKVWDQLVTISSEYPDSSDPSRHLKVRGSGFFVTANDKLYVFTASHVSQGDKIEILHHDKPVRILDRYSSGKSDLEIFRVEKPVDLQPTIHFDSKYFRVAAEDPINSNGNFRRRLLDHAHFVPLNDWIRDPNLDEDNRFSSTRENVLQLDALGLLFHGETLVQPGTSGAPLLRQTAQGLILLGTAIRRQRFFASSHFVSVYSMQQMLGEMEKPRQTSPPKVRWQATGPYLYRRDSQREITESSFSKINSAGGIIIDSGNGVLMDGGDGAALAEDQPMEISQKVSSAPTLAGEAVLTWILAMRHPQTSALISFPAWFDFEYMSIFERFQFATRQTEAGAPNLLANLTYRLPNDKVAFSEDCRSRLTVKDQKVQLSLAPQAASPFTMTLNAQGELCDETCEPAFLPVVSRGEGLHQWIVDLRGLFFVDASESIARNSEEPLDTLNAQAQKVSVVVRKRHNLQRPLTLQELLGQRLTFNKSAADCH